MIYDILTATTCDKLFTAGIVPGILGILLYLLAVRWTVWRQPDAGLADPRADWSGRLAALRGVWAVLLLFFIVIGGLYGIFGFAPLNLTFVPTEAAGMGTMGTFAIALACGGLSFSGLIEVLHKTAFTSASLFAVVIGARVFSNFVNLAGLFEALLQLQLPSTFRPTLCF